MQEKSCCRNHNDKSKFVPLGDRVLLKRVATESHASGIMLPDSAKKKPETAVVIAVGSGKRDKEGQIVEMPVKVGDTVLFSKYAGQEVTLDGEEFLIVSSTDIIARIETK